MQKTLTRAEILSAKAMERNPHSKHGAAKDLLDAVSLLLQDDDEGQMANEMAKLIAFESHPFRDCTEGDCDAAAERVCELAESMGTRFVMIAQRAAA